MKEIIANLDHTYTIRMIDGWSLTANASEVEKMFNECFDKTILPILKKLQ